VDLFDDLPVLGIADGVQNGDDFVYVVVSL